VAVEECAVDAGSAGDATDADLFACVRCVVEGLEHALAAAGGVGLAAFGHGRAACGRGGVGGCHAMRSVLGPVRVGWLRGMPSMTVR